MPDVELCPAKAKSLLYIQLALPAGKPFVYDSSKPSLIQVLPVDYDCSILNAVIHSQADDVHPVFQSPEVQLNFCLVLSTE